MYLSASYYFWAFMFDEWDVRLYSCFPSLPLQVFDNVVNQIECLSLHVCLGFGVDAHNSYIYMHPLLP